MGGRGATGRRLRAPMVAGLVLAACLGPVVPARALLPVPVADVLPSGPAPAVLEPLVPSSPAPSPDAVADQVSALAGSLGAGSVLVIDPASGQVLFDRQSGAARIPASTAKLATAAAALSVLGPQARLSTTVVREGRTIYLVGGGDPTLVRAGGGNPLAGGSASLKDLARATVNGMEGGTRVRVVYDASAFSGPALGPGWPRSFPAAGVAAPVSALVVDGGRVRPGALSRVSDPARQAAEVFAGYLRDAGLTVRSIKPGVATSAASTVASVESPPIEDIVQRMLTDSENNYAEALGHLVGGAALDQPTFAGGAQATAQALADLGIDTTGMSLVDASGLSVRNRLTVRVLAQVLSSVVSGERPEFAAIAPGLAVAGLTGTLADRFTTAATRAGRGFVQAKTGTLTGVSSLAGTVLDRDGRVVVFAMIANRVRSLPAVRDTMDRIASRLATCGCT